MSRSERCATPDGISTTDWNQVRQLATQVVEEISNGETFSHSKSRTQLLSLLRSLEKKYGRLPSFLATRADYKLSAKRKVSLLTEAYNLAREVGDDKNVTLVASSLAQLYLEELNDLIRGKAWIANLENALIVWSDDAEYKTLATLKTLVKSWGKS